MPLIPPLFCRQRLPATSRSCSSTRCLRSLKHLSYRVNSKLRTPRETCLLAMPLIPPLSCRQRLLLTTRSHSRSRSSSRCLRSLKHLSYRVNSKFKTPGEASPRWNFSQSLEKSTTRMIKLTRSPVLLSLGQGTYLNNIPSGPPAPNTATHFCSDNPKSTCSENGTIDFNLLLAFIAKYPDGLSMVEKAIEHFDPATALGSNDGLSTGQLSQADTNEPLSLPHGVARCEMASSDSSTAASTSTQAHSAPSGSCPISPKQFEAACEPSGSTRTDGSSTGKRRRSEEDGEPCNTTEGGEKRRKKKKLIQVDGEYICLICKILQLRCFPLSRRDSLKRHIARLHELFQILFESEFDGFKILERRQIDQDENLFPFILLCIALQMHARARGVKIKAEEDLMLKYPDVVPKAVWYSQS
ncbi:hypothetical protein EV363DRAFT_653542 [Boletus edulis]|nr:hypothetical protein EV363DRAFT_653542 [Boletus edulis]